MSPESCFLETLFKELNNSGVLYAVMRNSETLPYSLGGSDLDLLSKGDQEAKKIEHIVRRVVRECGGEITVRYKVEATILCAVGRYDDGPWWGVHIDIFPGLMYFGLPYMLTDSVFLERIFEKSSFYRCGHLSDVASFTKEILHNGKTKKSYYPMARSAYSSDPSGVRAAMGSCFGDRGWRTIEQLLSNEQSTDVVYRSSRKLVRSLTFQMIASGRFFQFVIVKLRNIYRRARRVLVPPGYSVAFLGTDGSGKSTIIESITPVLESMMHAKVHYEHLRPNLLPALAQLAGKPKKIGPTINPHGGKQSGLFSSLLRFFYYYIDYTFGYWIKIHPILVKRATMVVFDRYYYEYMIDQKRCAVRLLPGFARFFSWFIPKPDLILCLGGDPEKIYARKPETSLEEVTRQVNELKSFCSGNRRAVWIDTTCGIDESRDAALNAIMERMANR